MENYEFTIEETGGCGPFQVVHAVTSQTLRSICVWATFTMIFGSFDPGWRCVRDGLAMSQNVSNQGMEISLMTNNSVAYVSNATQTGISMEREYNGKCSEIHECSRIEFKPGSKTIVTEFGLVCDKFWIVSLTISIQFAGHAVGCLVAGPTGERIGRKLNIVIYFIPFAIVHALSVLCYSWELFVVNRFFTGLFDGGVLSTAMMFSLEVLTDRWRVVVGMMPFAYISLTIFAIIIYLERDWVYVQETISVSSLLILIPFMFLPESPRWLLVNGHNEKAERVLEKIAKMNRTKVPELRVHSDTRSTDTNQQEKRYSYIDLFTEKSLRFNMIILTWVWVFNMNAYYILSYSVKSLFGDFYINLIISFLAEIPLHFICCVITSWFGRCKTSAVCVFLAAICCALVLVNISMSDEEHGGLTTTVLVHITKALNSVAQAIIVLITAELSPTVIRVLSNSYFRCVSRLGCIAAPFVIPSDKESFYISFSIMTALYLSNTIFLLILPETKGCTMSDRVGQRENKKENKKKITVNESNTTAANIASYGSIMSAENGSTCIENRSVHVKPESSDLN